MTDAYDRVVWRGVTLDKITAAAAEAAQVKLGREFDSIPQGSWSHASASAGTHSGAGAIDIYDRDLDAVTHAMRAVGFASWHRTYLPGEWSAHCHSILIGDHGLADEAAQQVRDYYNHIDGLAGHDGRDDTWHPSPIPVFNYEKDGAAAYASGDVYVPKLRYGVDNSDSVKRLQYRLQTNVVIARGGVSVDGDFGDQTKAALADWQRTVAEHGPNDGSAMGIVQANRMFGHKNYKVHETLQR